MLRTAIENAALEVILTIIDDGEKAIRYINSLSEQGGAAPKVFIIDFQLPKKNGFEIISLIKSIELFKSIPVILFTGTDPNKGSSGMLRAGRDVCVQAQRFFRIYTICTAVKEFSCVAMNSQRKNTETSEQDLRTHFMIGVVSDDPNGLKKAHVFWRLLNIYK